MIIKNRKTKYTKHQTVAEYTNQKIAETKNRNEACFIVSILLAWLTVIENPTGLITLKKTLHKH